MRGMIYVRGKRNVLGRSDGKMEVVPTTRRAYCEWDTEVAREKNLESEEDEEELWELFDEEGMSDPFVTGVVEEFGRTAHYNRWKQARKVTAPHRRYISYSIRYTFFNI